MENKQTVIGALKKLKVHPFTQIQLSDKEKFHTGMLSYALNNHPSLFESIFMLGSENYVASVEEDSIDLLIREKVDENEGKGNLKLIVESKFKTGLHKSKTPKNNKPIYGDKVNQLVKMQLSNPGLGGDDYSGYYLLSLFPEKLMDGIHLIRPNKLVSIQFTNTVLDELDKVNANANNDALIPLWIDYLKNLKVLVDYFIENEMNCINLKNLDSDISLSGLLKDIKLNGVFESYRYGLVQQKVEEKLSDEIKKSLMKSCNNRNELEQVGELFNSHGNGGLHYALAMEEKTKSFGIQWQGALKLFIETSNPSSKNGVSEICKILNFERTVKKNDALKDPSSGKFSSLTSKDNWDIYGNLFDKPEEIVEYLESLNQNKIKKIVENQN
jgi:hypothetical protein